MRRMILAGVLGVLLTVQTASGQRPAVKAIEVRHANGQTYLMWNEAGLTPEKRLAVYKHTAPITEKNLTEATLLSGDLMPGSSCDYSDLRKAEYKRFTALPTEGVRGAVVPWDGRLDEDTGHVVPGRIEPYHGLYVHTPKVAGEAWFAVVVREDGGKALTKIVPRQSALEEPVKEAPVGRLAPIQVAGPPLTRTAGEELKPLFVVLHAVAGFQHDAKAARDAERRKLANARHYVAYGTWDQAWREGVMFQWSVYATDPEQDGRDRYELWLDDSNFAFMGFPNTCWYGVNRNVARPEELTEGEVAPTNERRVIDALEWTLATFPIDRNRVPMYGSSMGGGGGLSIAARYPRYFSGLEINVGPPSWQKISAITGKRALEVWGPPDQPIRASDGGTIWERMDTLAYLRKHKVRMPVMILSYGRTDPLVPWEHNVPFFKLMLEQGQPMHLVWDDKGHGGRTCWKAFPEAGEILKALHERTRARPYLAFAHGTANDDLGDGSAESGDDVGAINVFYHYENVIDTPERFSVEYWYDKRGETDGGKTDLIPGWLRRFPHAAGCKAKYRILHGDEVVVEGTTAVGEHGVYRIVGAPADRRCRLELTPVGVE